MKRPIDLFFAGRISLATVIDAEEPPSPFAHRMDFVVVAFALFVVLAFALGFARTGGAWYAVDASLALAFSVASLHSALRSRRRYVAALAAHRAALATIDAVLRGAAPQEPS